MKYFYKSKMIINNPTGKIPTQFDIPEMLEVYANRSNYEIIDLNKNDDRCFIYFSSNGLYFPDNSETFRRVVIENNRFEWKKNILQSANKVIFLRDVTKQWYLEGINADINTIEKLASFLAEQTRGLKVICVGSSAGGYAATLFGCLLNASHVFNFSGQFSLWDFLQNEEERAQNPTLVKHEKNPEFEKYFSIIGFIIKSKTPIYYLFPAKSDRDIYQSKLVADIATVYEFGFDSASHGTTCLKFNLPDVIALGKEKAYKIHLRYKKVLITQLSFSIKISGLTRTLINKFKQRLGLRKTPVSSNE